MNQPPSRVISDRQAWAETSAYVTNVGMVAHAWNSLHEALCDVFVHVVGAREEAVSKAVWHSTYNDRSQREMLRAAIENTKAVGERERTDLLWALVRINSLSADRDNAIHAPILITGEIGEIEVVASFLSGHRRAKNLIGKQLIVEFDWCKRYAGSLNAFVSFALASLQSGGALPWPDKPSAPNRRPKKAVLGRQPRQPPP